MQFSNHVHDIVEAADVRDPGDLEIPFESVALIELVIVREIRAVVPERVDVPIVDKGRILERARPSVDGTLISTIAPCRHTRNISFMVRILSGRCSKASWARRYSTE
jgi:hypothetical protein